MLDNGLTGVFGVILSFAFCVEDRYYLLALLYP